MKRSALVVALLFLAISGVGQISPKLGIRVSSLRDSYSVRDSVQIEIVRENMGNEPLLIPREWGWGVMRTEVWVFDASGRQVHTDFLPDELPPPPRPYDFVLLNPGQFVGTRLNEHLTHFVTKPGDYVFVVRYTSYLSENYAREVMQMPDVPFWSRERGTVTSNKIKLHITR